MSRFEPIDTAPKDKEFTFTNGDGDFGIGWFVDGKFCTHSWRRFKGKTVAVYWLAPPYHRD